mgnify:CR=1 FL=1
MSARNIKRSLRIHRHRYGLIVPGQALSFLEQYRRWNQ